MITGSAVTGGMSVQQAAARLFYAQTGVALPASSASVEADPNDAETTQVVVMTMSASELTMLATLAGQAIAAGTAPEGVLSSVEAISTVDAVARLGPVPPPPGGWAAFVVNQVYGGSPPGALDTVFPLLVSQIAQRTQSSPDIFESALLLALRDCANPA